MAKAILRLNSERLAHGEPLAPGTVLLRGELGVGVDAGVLDKAIQAQQVGVDSVSTQSVPKKKATGKTGKTAAEKSA